MNTLVVYFLIAVLIALIGFSIFWLFKYKKILSRYNNIINRLRDQIHKTKINLFEESQRVDLHREELLSQTEHLQDLNIELERLSFVASKTDSAVIIADEKGDFIWVNQGFNKLYGYTLSEFINKVGGNLFNVSRKSDIESKIKTAVKKKESLNYTSMLQTKNGENKWVKTTLNPIYDDDNNLKQYIIIDTDVSELKLINDKLRKLSMVASKTNNSVIIFNHNNEIDWVNEGFHRMYGYTKKEYVKIYGKTLTDFCKANNQPDLIDDLSKNQESVSFVNSFTDSTNNTKWKQTTLTPIWSEHEGITNYIIVENDISRVKEAEQKMQLEKEKADKLLLNILPEETAEELKSKGRANARFYRSVSVLFADIQDFTKLVENLTPEELVDALQSYFSKFDDAVSRNFVEKIKTMGDAFLCVGGIPMRNKSHPFDAVLVGLELQRIIKELGKEREEEGKRAWQLRIGIHTGPVVAGVVGKQKMTYDIWGDTVNIAKRVESACVPGMVNVSATTYEIIKDYFECEHRGKIMAKHKGHIDMYFVKRIKSEFSENADGITPNKYFQEMRSQL